MEHYIGLASLAFCVTLVVRRDGALTCDVDGSGANTLSLAGCRPTNSTVLYQLQGKVKALILTSRCL
jgi:hypothetical protein